MSGILAHGLYTRGVLSGDWSLGLTGSPWCLSGDWSFGSTGAPWCLSGDWFLGSTGSPGPQGDGGVADPAERGRV